MSVVVPFLGVVERELNRLVAKFRIRAGLESEAAGGEATANPIERARSRTSDFATERRSGRQAQAAGFPRLAASNAWWDEV